MASIQKKAGSLLVGCEVDLKMMVNSPMMNLDHMAWLFLGIGESGQNHSRSASKARHKEITEKVGE
jgi:hypothetical protein